MAGKVLATVFWIVGAALVVISLLQGGWALLIPLAVLLALLLFGLDLLRHRELVAFDLDLLRALLHVLSAVALAATIMFWLGRLLLTGGGG